MENKELARQILQVVGPGTNVRQATHCMTRLRLVLDDQDVDRESLKKLPGVMGVNQSGPELQIILGPGKAAQVTDAFNALLAAPEEAMTPAPEKKAPEQPGKSIFPQGEVGDGKALHEAIRAKNATPAKLFLKRISSIFVPLIPGFIGCGLLTGILNIVRRLDPVLAQNVVFQILGLAGNTVFWGMNLFVGWNAAREFGGSPVLGGALGALISHPGLSGIVLNGPALTPGRGGVVAVLIVAALGAQLEKNLHQRVPEALDLFLTPFLVMGIMGFATLYVFQPLGGFIAEGIGFAATEAVARGGALTGFLLGGTFLPLVMLGVHQGLTPIHAQLIAQYGYTILLPILAMAGGGQVGAAAAVYLKTKDPDVKRVVASALPVGLMGVGEPLIYGVTLPLGRPFIGACIGGALGGAVQAACQVGAGALGISGLPLAPSTTQVTAYLTGLAISYAGGFVATWVLGFTDPVQSKE
ncbi:PTS transporter subunit EIIC [Acidaminococcus timonensis]|uniref:PTS transporter subunit EIIC n=1 Tax=Acidaminococcus timonensis TaxID=1871002 RepID=UPI00307AF0E7